MIQVQPGWGVCKLPTHTGVWYMLLEQVKHTLLAEQASLIATLLQSTCYEMSASENVNESKEASLSNDALHSNTSIVHSWLVGIHHTQTLVLSMQLLFSIS